MTPPSPLDEPFLTDRLCYIIAEQNEIIKEQANTIAQLDAIKRNHQRTSQHNRTARRHQPDGRTDPRSGRFEPRDVQRPF